MELVEHRNCIMLHEVYDEPLTICLVMDLVTGGELFDRIIAKGFYSEKDAAEVTREVLQVGAGRATHTVRLTAVAIRGG
jgi:calcium/calmodulin-dependent protein kinase-4